MAIVSVKRDRGLKVLLSDSLYRDLEYVCERMGQTPAVLGSVALSEYVADRKAVLEMAESSLEKVTERLVLSLGDGLRDEIRALVKPDQTSSSSSSDGGQS